MSARNRGNLILVWTIIISFVILVIIIWNIEYIVAGFKTDSANAASEQIFSWYYLIVVGMISSFITAFIVKPLTGWSPMDGINQLRCVFIAPFVYNKFKNEHCDIKMWIKEDMECMFTLKDGESGSIMRSPKTKTININLNDRKVGEVNGLVLLFDKKSISIINDYNLLSWQDGRINYKIEDENIYRNGIKVSEFGVACGYVFIDFYNLPDTLNKQDAIIITIMIYLYIMKHLSIYSANLT